MQTPTCRGRQTTEGREYESSKGQHCGIYIFLQEEAEDTTCAEANNYCGSCSPSAFLFHVFVSATTFLFDNLPFFNGLFFSDVETIFSWVGCDATCRTMLRASHVETEVDHGGVAERF